MANERLEFRIERTQPISRLKIKEWVSRYGPAEIVGTATAYASFFIMKDMTDSLVAAAYAGTVGENIGFYGTMILKYFLEDKKNAKSEGKQYGVDDAIKSARSLIIEFGPAEALDSLVVRPAAMGLGSRILGEELGVLAGKIAADISFYIPAIISYEARKHLSKNTKH